MTTKIEPAFRVELPEDQGSLCLTADGLRSLRAKIDKAVGVQLPDRCPPGTPSDVWFKHQDLMASQRTRRLEQEARNTKLRGDTDAETAQNIVTALNSGAMLLGRPMITADVLQEPKLTWKPGQGEPDPRVKVWTRAGRFDLGSMIELERKDDGTFQYRSSGSFKIKVRPHQLTVGMLGAPEWAEKERFEPKLGFTMSEKAPEPDPGVRVWEADRSWIYGPGKETITVHETPDGRVYKHSRREGAPTDWASLVKWSILGREWTERQRFAVDEG